MLTILASWESCRHSDRRAAGGLQQWMTTVVTARGSLTEKLQAAAEQHGLAVDEVVAEKRGLSAGTRLNIYATGYVLRLLECMRADFPALRKFTGDAVFDAFAKAYIISEPPTSPSLFDLGSGFPAFLERTKPHGDDMQAELLPLLDLPPEIAAFERARVEVMRAPGTENDPPEKEPFFPLEIFNADIKVQTLPCLRLLKLRFPLIEFLKKLDLGEHPDPPAPETAFVALSRSHYQIQTKAITPWQFAFLKSCAQPVSLYSVVQRAAQESGADSATILAQMVIWLPIAREAGMVR